VLHATIEAQRRTALCARYRVIGSCATAIGVLAAAVPDFRKIDPLTAGRGRQARRPANSTHVGLIRVAT
jgi:hypothetical protein